MVSPSVDPFTNTDVDPRVIVDVAGSVISIVLDALVDIETFSASLVLKITVDSPLLVDCSIEVEFSGNAVAIDCSEVTLLIADVEFSVDEAIDEFAGLVDDDVATDCSELELLIADAEFSDDKAVDELE
jgi:hypothetical protein